MEKIEHIKISKRLKMKPDAEEIPIIGFLHNELKLSKALLKSILTFGGCWLRIKGKAKAKRVRKGTKLIHAGDTVEFYYDSNIDLNPEFNIEPLYENKHWGIWFKPANIVTQGSKFGDKNSILYHIQKRNSEARIIHRLDRETAGLLFIAYDKKNAGEFSKIWNTGDVTKTYQAIAKGVMEETEGTIDLFIDDKDALTTYKVMDIQDRQTHLELEIKTGRFHQIRRHLKMLGYPVMGDPKYGKGNKNRDGLMLREIGLKFKDPMNQREYSFVVNDEDKLF